MIKILSLIFFGLFFNIYPLFNIQPRKSITYQKNNKIITRELAFIPQTEKQKKKNIQYIKSLYREFISSNFIKPGIPITLGRNSKNEISHINLNNMENDAVIFAIMRHMPSTANQQGSSSTAETDVLLATQNNPQILGISLIEKCLNLMICSANQKRNYITAALINICNSNIYISDKFNEQDFGDLKNQPIKEIIKNPKFQRAFVNKDIPLPNGESGDQVIKRFISGLQEVLPIAQKEKKLPIIISNRGTMNWFCRYALDNYNLPLIMPDNLSIILCAYFPSNNTVSLVVDNNNIPVLLTYFELLQIALSPINSNIFSNLINQQIIMDTNNIIESKQNKHEQTNTIVEFSLVNHNL